MFPELLEIGPIHLRSYGLLLAIGFLAATWWALRDAGRRGLDGDQLVSLIFILLVSGILGARFLYVLGHLDYFGRHPIESLYVWRGGLTLWGGVVVAIPVGIYTTMRRGMDTWVVADVIAAPMALGTTFGRMGCFLNGCCYGVPTSQPWGVHFPAASEAAIHFGEQALHPSQIYNALAGLAVFAIVLLSARFLRAPGQRWWLFMGLYALLRSLIDVTRYYDASAYLHRWQGGGITQSQIIGAALIAVSVAAFVWLGRRHRRRAGVAA